MPVKVTKNTMSPSLGKIVAKVEKLPNEAYKFWKNVTPKRTGNAKRRTRLQGNKIKANYNYAVPLDQGRSKQAPEGMSKPTERYIRNELDRIMRK